MIETEVGREVEGEVERGRKIPNSTCKFERFLICPQLMILALIRATFSRYARRSIGVVEQPIFRIIVEQKFSSLITCSILN